MTRSELKKSLIRQWELLNEDEILFHSFWHGNKEKEIQELIFIYYTEEEMREIVKDYYEVLELKKYKAMDHDEDSFYEVLKIIR